jgi:class 3 adenylate cyclase
MGTRKQADPVYNKQIRFANSVSLIVCFFIVQNAALAVYYNQPLLILVYIMHFVMIALMPVFNHRGKRVLASAWFSGVAILFVTFYAIVFTLDSYNFVFLSMILFLQFFLFSASEKKYIVIFSAITLICFVGAVLWQELHVQPFLLVPEGLLRAQRLNSLIGIPLLSIAFGIYAFSTIHKAEREAAWEKEKTEQLLLNILPQAVADRFKNDQSYLAEGYQSVTVLFADIVGFTSLSENIAPDDLVKFLNEVFSKFDEFTETYGLEKIKTIGDAYMVAGGAPTPSNHHTRSVCQMALKMQEAIQDIKSPSGEPVSIRIGISTGPVTAGVIGVKKFIYDLWGDTVNTASRMESYSEAGAIQITSEVYELIKNEFDCKVRGTIQVKGKGTMTTYFLMGVKE